MSVVWQVKHGYSKRVWCALIGKTLYYFRSQEDKVTSELPVTDLVKVSKGQLSHGVGLCSSRWVRLSCGRLGWRRPTGRPSRMTR